MKPDVSVIIPVYNGEKTIKECLDSVLSQTLYNIEVIVINDGSGDDTLKILHSFKDSRLKIITTENSGQGLSRNRGIDIAQGTYIGFVDADDTVDAEMYEHMHNIAKENGAQIVQCAIKDIRGENVTVRPIVGEITEKTEKPDEYADKYFYTLKHTNEVCNKIFLKSFLKENNLRFCDTKRIYSEDLRMNIDLLPYIRCISFTDRAFYNYNIKEEGHCLKNPEQRFTGIFRLYEESVSGLSSKHLKRCVKSSAVITLLSYFAATKENRQMKKIITSQRFKNYLFSSAVYKKSFKHILLMGALITMPYFIKKSIIKKHYTFD